MKKPLSYLPILTLLFISCTNSEKIKITFNDQLEVNDLLSQNEYHRLYKDDDYKDYINEFFENTVEMHSIVIKGSELMAESNLVGDEIGSDMSVDLFFSGLKGAGSMAMKGYTMMGLEDDKKELYASFSNSKIALANEFEDKVIEILKTSNIAPKNPNVKPSDMLLNYKSYGPEIKDDDRLRDNLSDLTDDVDELFLLSYKIRIQQNLNIALGNEIDDFSQITNLGLKSLEENGNYPIDIDSNMLDKYFESVNDILEEIKRIESNLSIPVEDWSEAKRSNYLFIIEDIKIKLREDISNFILSQQNNRELFVEEINESESADEYLNEIETIVENLNSNDHLSAINKINEALEVYPDDGYLYQLRGKCRYFLKDYKGSIEDYNIAIQRNPSIPDLYSERARSKHSLLDYEGEIKDYTAAITLNPNEPDYYYNRASAKRMLQDYTGAISDYTTVIKMNPNEKEYIPNIMLSYYDRAFAKLEIEDYEGAINDITQNNELAKDLDISDQILSNILVDNFITRASLKTKAMDYVGAIQDFNKSLELDPENAKAFYLRGRVKELNGKPEESCKDLIKAKELGYKFSRKFKTKCF
jgi:tetratricopeptide (TPR) repeat protein